MLKEQLNHATRIREQVSIRRAISIFISIYIYIYEKGKKYDTIVSSTEILTLHRITLCSISKLILRSFFSFFFITFIHFSFDEFDELLHTNRTNCLFNWKKKKKERGKDTHRNAPTTGMEQRGQKFFFHRIKKKGEKKKNILFENVRQHDTIGTLRFFFTVHGSAFRFLSRNPWRNPGLIRHPLHIRVPIPSPPSCCHRNLCHERRERERERDVIKKNSRKFSKKTCPAKGDIRLPRKNPQYSRVMTDNYLEGFGTKEGSRQGRGGLEGGGKHVSLVNDNDEHWCKPDDNA